MIVTRGLGEEQYLISQGFTSILIFINLEEPVKKGAPSKPIGVGKGEELDPEKYGLKPPQILEKGIIKTKRVKIPLFDFTITADVVFLSKDDVKTKNVILEEMDYKIIYECFEKEVQLLN